MAVVQVFLVCPAVFANLLVSTVQRITTARKHSRPGEKNRRQWLEYLKDEVDGHQLLVVVGPRESV